jgi:hypothetical protein
MEAITEAAKEASCLDIDRPDMPAPLIGRPNDMEALRTLGVAMVGRLKRPLIE